MLGALIARLNRLRGLDPEWNELADRMGAPYDYIVCPHCGAQRWRLPPHNLSPCPLVERMSESFGLKFDAERNQTIVASQHLVAVSRFMQEEMERRREEEE